MILLNLLVENNMSMNLYCNIDDKQVDLVQTPTHITYMCLTESDGIHYQVTGKKAVRALRCYLEWNTGRLNGIWNSNIEYINMKGSVEAQNNYILDLINNGKKFKVYIV